jgi:peptide/nickel transport system permease protein
MHPNSHHESADTNEQVAESYLVFVARRFKKHKGAVIGFISFITIIFLIVIAPLITQYDPISQNLDYSVQAPSTEHPLGTDHFGRDVLSRILFGGRVSLLVGPLVVGVGILFGLPIGMIGGYIGGRVDNILMRFMDALMSFPPLLLAIAIVAFLGPGIVNAMIALGIVRIPRFARLVRSVVLYIKEYPFIEAARALGGSTIKILIRHILPNIIAPILVQSTFSMAGAIISEAGLSFLGLGVQPPAPSWGRDLTEWHRYLREAPWLAIFPTLTIMVTVLSINFVGDGLRDALDPRVATTEGH